KANPAHPPPTNSTNTSPECTPFPWKAPRFCSSLYSSSQAPHNSPSSNHHSNNLLCLQSRLQFHITFLNNNKLVQLFSCLLSVYLHHLEIEPPRAPACRSSPHSEGPRDTSRLLSWFQGGQDEVDHQSPTVPASHSGPHPFLRTIGHQPGTLHFPLDLLNG
ncbi:hypothetical protein AMECASPLE_035845, partial [Ameca splendens]